MYADSRSNVLSIGTSYAPRDQRELEIRVLLGHLFGDRGTETAPVRGFGSRGRVLGGDGD